MRRVLPDSVLEEIGRLDPAAIAEVCDEAWPDVRDAEELHDALLTLIALPVGTEILRGNNGLSKKLRDSVPAWTPLFDQLAAERRPGLARLLDSAFSVASQPAS